MQQTGYSTTQPVYQLVQPQPSTVQGAPQGYMANAQPIQYTSTPAYTTSIPPVGYSTAGTHFHQNDIDLKHRRRMQKNEERESSTSQFAGAAVAFNQLMEGSMKFLSSVDGLDNMSSGDSLDDAYL